MILFLLVLAGIFYAAERYSLVHGLDGILVKTETDRIVVEPGEPFLWTLTVKNGNRRMAPYLETAVREYREESGDEKADFLLLPATNPLWVGSENHPGKKEHALAAEVLIDRVEGILKQS